MKISSKDSSLLSAPTTSTSKMCDHPTGYEPQNIRVSFNGSTLEWENSETKVKGSVPVGSLVAIRESKHDSYKAFYLGHPTHQDGSGNGSDGDADTQLKNLLIPSSALESPEAEELRKYVLPRLPVHLDRNTANDSATNATPVEIHVAISTLAGTQKALPFFKNALKPLLETLGVAEYTVHETESANTVIELCEGILVPRAKQGVKQTVILLSGDGGVVDVIKVFSEKCGEEDTSTFVPPTLCVIPMGTGNATANSATPESDSTLGLSTLVRGTARRLPTFRVTLSPGAAYLVDEGRRKEAIADQSDEAHVHGAVVVSWGMHASLVADSDTSAYRKFGTDRFMMAGKELLWPADGSQTHRYQGRMQLTVDNDGSGNLESVDIDRTEHMYVLVTLVRQLEKGFTISPASKALDGQLRIVHFGPLAPERGMGVMELAYQGGKHVDEPEVGYRAVEKVRIEFEELEERWRRVCVDGKIVVVPQGGWLEVERDHRGFIELVVV